MRGSWSRSRCCRPPCILLSPLLPFPLLLIFNTPFLLWFFLHRYLSGTRYLPGIYLLWVNSQPSSSSCPILLSFDTYYFSGKKSSKSKVFFCGKCIHHGHPFNVGTLKMLSDVNLLPSVANPSVVIHLFQAHHSMVTILSERSRLPQTSGWSSAW